MSKFPTLLAAMVVVAVLLASCNLPFLQQNTAAVQTEAALTVEAALTSAAPAATTTFTAAPFPTLPPATATVPSATSAPAVSATSNCDAALFIADVTYPDDASVDAGSAFTKTWRLKNVGTCSWTTSYALVFKTGESMGGPAAQALTGNVNPGESIEVSVGLTAPTAAGTHRGDWGLRNAAGGIFTSFYVRITVGSGSGGGAFAVTSVTYTLSTWSDSGHTDCPRVIANIITNGSGTVTYHWTRSDGSSAATATLTFGSAGTQSINYDWALGSANAGTTHWVGIYIDNPNHQDFNHKEFTTVCTSP